MKEGVESDDAASVLDNVKNLCGFRIEDVLSSEESITEDDDIEKMKGINRKELKAALISDDELPPGSIEFDGNYSAWTTFSTNVQSKLLSAAVRFPLTSNLLNRILTNKAASSGTNRPYQLTCKADYTSYESLTDYSYYGRHLPPASQEWIDNLPPIDEVAKLFERQKTEDGNETQVLCFKSTMLFPTFAQHLIDSFIDTVYEYDENGNVQFHWEKTESPHDIGLLTLYGKTIPQTKQLRLQSEDVGEKGKLKSQMIKGEEWAPFLYDDNLEKKREFSELPSPQGIDGGMFKSRPELQARLKQNIFAFGGARTNLIPAISAWNILLLREHNRLAGLIEKENPSWDDERVFQVARNCLLAIYLRLVIEEYINHITPYGQDFKVKPGKWMWNAPWYKRNWISAEFAVLYRWHALIPNAMKWGDKTYSTLENLFDNGILLSDMGADLRECFHNICNHRATKMQLHNSDSVFMVGRDKKALEQSRACKLRSFGEYCEYLGKEKPKTFADISKDKDIQKELEKVYGNVDNVEFWTGLIAKDSAPESIMSDELTLFVANDAFNQALTHPLLSEHVFNKDSGPKVFSKVGWEIVNKVPSINEILQRNSKGGAKYDAKKPQITMTKPDYHVPLASITKFILFLVFACVLGLIFGLIFGL